VTTAGGVFGPLYRALNLLGRAIAAKMIAVLVIGAAAAALFSVDDDSTAASVIGAWLINGFYVVSVGLTAWFALRALRRAARSQREQPR